MNVCGADQVEALENSGYFDAAWYVDTYPDVRGLGMSAAEHFLRIGVVIGRDLSATCSNARYLDMVATGDRGRSAPASEEDAASPASPMQHEGSAIPWRLDAIVTADYFDRDRYLERYPEVAIEELDPFWHFKAFGFEEGRVGSFFDAGWYLLRHGDVGVHGFDAFDHYKLFGASEGWAARFVHISQSGISH